LKKNQLLLVVRLAEKGLSTDTNFIGCCDKNSVNNRFPINQHDTFSMIGKKSQASHPIFFHLSFPAIY